MQDKAGCQPAPVGKVKKERNMGSIIINRGHNPCGKNSSMEITINGSTQTFKDTVEDGGETTVEVPNGIYKVFVKFGIRSNILGVLINNNKINLTATIKHIPDKAIIEQVILQ
jgi:hypothetical protein